MSTLDHGSVPDRDGRFGPYGGRYVPETLMAALEELDAAYRDARADPSFLGEIDRLLREFVGRPTQLTPAPRLSAHAGGAASPPNAPGAGNPPDPAGSCPAAVPDASGCACLRPAGSKASCAPPQRDESPGELLAYVSSEEPEGQSWLPWALPWPEVTP